jgi:hypothetical protein
MYRAYVEADVMASRLEVGFAQGSIPSKDTSIYCGCQDTGPQHSGDGSRFSYGGQVFLSALDCVILA